MSAPHKTPDFAREKLIIGIDVHKRQWTATFRMAGVQLKTETMNPDPKGLFRYVSKRYPGAEYYSAYESGFCGFWIHRKLVDLDIKNIVFNAADIPTTDKEKRHKRDKIDSRKIARESIEFESLKAGVDRYKFAAIKLVLICLTEDAATLYYNLTIQCSSIKPCKGMDVC